MDAGARLLCNGGLRIDANMAFNLCLTSPLHGQQQPVAHGTLPA